MVLEGMEESEGIQRIVVLRHRGAGAGGALEGRWHARAGFTPGTSQRRR